MHTSVTERLTAEMTTYGPVQKGISFPKMLFGSGPARQRVATFDAAYDLSCQVLGMHRLDVLDEGDQLRFLPSLCGIG